MKIGGQIPWNAIPFCDMLQISYLMGKLQTRDVFENHSKDRLFHLVHWLSITLSLRKTSRESINLGRKSYLDCSSDTLCTRVEFGRVTYWLQTCEGLETMDASEICSKKTQCKRGDISQRKWKIYFSSRRWTNQTSWRRSGPENIHLDTGTSNSRRIRSVSSTTSRLISGCR